MMNWKPFQFGRSAVLVIMVSLTCTAGSFIFIESQRDQPVQSSPDWHHEWNSLPPDVAAAFDAARHGQCSKLDELLSRQPTLVDTDSVGFSLMDLAAVRGDTDIAEVLLKHHAEIDAPDRAGATPLDYAAFVGSKGMVQWLIARKANVNAHSEGDMTPIYYAARGSARIDNPNTDYIGVCDMLLKAGAAADTTTMMGHSAIQVASEPVARFLFDHGATLTAWSRPVDIDGSDGSASAR